MGFRLLLIGATGLVGRQVLRQALDMPGLSQVCAPTRRALPADRRLLNPLVDFETLPAGDWWEADACICTLGTTLRLAGSREAFVKVDHGYVLNAARHCLAAGTPCFAYNSSLGAAVSSRSFYLQTKGMVEQDLSALGFTSLSLVRPSLIDGGPRPDPRPGERFALALTRLLGPLLPRRIRPVTTQAIAARLLTCALAAKPGIQIIESQDI